MPKLRPCFIMEGDMQALFRRMSINLDLVLFLGSYQWYFSFARGAGSSMREASKTSCWFEIPAGPCNDLWYV